jgi:hypothetical protein
MSVANEIFAAKAGNLKVVETESSTHVGFVVDKVANLQCVISGFRREIDEVCALPGY